MNAILDGDAVKTRENVRVVAPLGRRQLPVRLSYFTRGEDFISHTSRRAISTRLPQGALVSFRFILYDTSSRYSMHLHTSRGGAAKKRYKMITHTHDSYERITGCYQMITHCKANASARFFSCFISNSNSNNGTVFTLLLCFIIHNVKPCMLADSLHAHKRHFDRVVQ